MLFARGRQEATNSHTSVEPVWKADKRMKAIVEHTYSITERPEFIGCCLLSS